MAFESTGSPLSPLPLKDRLVSRWWHNEHVKGWDYDCFLSGRMHIYVPPSATVRRRGVSGELEGETSLQKVRQCKKHLH